MFSYFDGLFTISSGFKGLLQRIISRINNLLNFRLERTCFSYILLYCTTIGDKNKNNFYKENNSYIGKYKRYLLLACRCLPEGFISYFVFH